MHNITPTKAVSDITPYEAWHGKKPSVDHLRVFGCICYSHVPKDERRKLDPKARKAIFLGYGTTVKGYRLYDLKSKKIFYSRDVTFDESRFKSSKGDLYKIEDAAYENEESKEEVEGAAEKDEGVAKNEKAIQEDESAVEKNQDAVLNEKNENQPKIIEGVAEISKDSLKYVKHNVESRYEEKDNATS